MSDMSSRRYYGGLYADRDAAERGIRRFHEAGYDRNRIGIIARNRDEAGKLADDTGADMVAGATTGAVAGGVIGALTGLGFPEEEATYYDRGIREGRYFVSVEDEDAAKVNRYFDETGADYYRTGRTTNVNVR